MDLQERTRRFGIYVILCACIFRFAAAGGTAQALQRMTDVNMAPFLTYLETGRNVRFSASSGKNMDFFRESPAPWREEPPSPSFLPEEAESIEIDNDSSLGPDVAALLAKPLDWDLKGGKPAVLILHTHTTESYTPGEEGYVPSASYRTLEEAHNMLSIGEAAAEILEANGIGVIHDRTVHDHPSYTDAYVHARQRSEEILAEYPTIQLILDLHRDASQSGRKQLRTQAVVAGESCAQLMFVVGTDVSRPAHENWEENLSLALKLHLLLEKQAPGIMRPLNLRRQRFNQDLSPGALLVEVGAAGNTRQEALRAVQALAEAVVKLSAGTGRTDGTVLE